MNWQTVDQLCRVSRKGKSPNTQGNNLKEEKADSRHKAYGLVAELTGPNKCCAFNWIVDCKLIATEPRHKRHQSSQQHRRDETSARHCHGWTKSNEDT